MTKRKKFRNVVKEEPQSPSRRKFLLLGGAVAAGAGLAALLRRSGIKPSAEPASVPERTAAVFKPDNSRIRLVFQFENHGTREHGVSIEPLLKKYRPQVVCRELAAKSETNARHFEDIFYSRKIDDPYYGAFQDVLRRNGKPRVFSLERFSDRESKEINEKFKVLLQQPTSFRLFMVGKSSEAISEFRQYLEGVAELQHRRNSEVNRVMSKLHAELVSRFPELSKEKKLTVLVRYGTAHAHILNHALGAGFGEVVGKMPEPALAVRKLHPHDVFSIRREWNLPRDESDGEIARLLLTNALTGIALHHGVEFEDAIWFSAESVKHITLGQFKQLSALTSQHIASGKKEMQAIRAALATHNIIYPLSKEEVHEFLRQKRIPLTPE